MFAIGVFIALGAPLSDALTPDAAVISDMYDLSALVADAEVKEKEGAAEILPVPLLGVAAMVSGGGGKSGGDASDDLSAPAPEMWSSTFQDAVDSDWKSEEGGSDNDKLKTSYEKMKAQLTKLLKIAKQTKHDLEKCKNASKILVDKANRLPGCPKSASAVYNATILPGYSEGQKMHVMLPHNHELVVEVPEGKGPGDQVEVWLPNVDLKEAKAYNSQVLPDQMATLPENQPIQPAACAVNLTAAKHAKKQLTVIPEEKWGPMYPCISKFKYVLEYPGRCPKMDIVGTISDIFKEEIMLMRAVFESGRQAIGLFSEKALDDFQKNSMIEHATHRSIQLATIKCAKQTPELVSAPEMKCLKQIAYPADATAAMGLDPECPRRVLNMTWDLPVDQKQQMWRRIKQFQHALASPWDMSMCNRDEFFLENPDLPAPKENAIPEGNLCTARDLFRGGSIAKATGIAMCLRIAVTGPGATPLQFNDDGSCPQADLYNSDYEVPKHADEVLSTNKLLELANEDPGLDITKVMTELVELPKDFYRALPDVDPELLQQQQQDVDPEKPEESKDTIKPPPDDSLEAESREDVVL